MNREAAGTAVIARSASDEAIQPRLRAMDCFACVRMTADDSIALRHPGYMSSDRLSPDRQSLPVVIA